MIPSDLFLIFSTRSTCVRLRAPSRVPVRRAGMCLLFAVLLSLCSVFPVLAVDGDDAAAANTTVLDSLFSVPAIVVEAPRVTRNQYDVFKRSGFVAVLDLDTRRNRVEDLSTVLERTVGVRVRQYGGLGSFATVSIRGSSSNQVDVFLDGIPLNDAYGGMSNLGDLPLGGVEAIEVYRGFTPPHLGSSAIGGAVNLTTRGGVSGAGSPESRAEARLSYGSFNTAREVLSLWGGKGGVRLFAHGGHFKSDGNFTFVDDGGTPENSEDDKTTERVNNDSDAWNVMGGVHATVPVLRDVSLNINYFQREGGVAGIGRERAVREIPPGPTLKARSKRERHMVYLRVDPGAVWTERLTLTGQGFYIGANEQFSDPEGEINLVRQDTDNDFLTTGLQGRSTFDPKRLPVKFELFGEGKYEKYHPESTLPSPTSGPDRRRTSFAGVLSGDVVLERLGLVLTAAGRYQTYTSEFYDPPRFPWLPPTPQGKVTRDNASPRVGFRWLAASFLTFKGNWGRYYRLPTFVELFGNTGSVTGSAGLEPEEGLNRDIGVVISDAGGIWKFENVFIEFVYLDNEVNNLILFFPNSQFTTRPQNIGAAHIRGVEFSLSSQIGRHFRFGGNYSYLDSRDESPIPYYNGNQLPSRPRHTIGFSADVILDKWKFSYEFNHIGENYLDPANHMAVPAREIHNAAVQWRPLANGVLLAFEGRNLSDNQISDVNGFPLPGRSVFVTVGYQP